MYVSVRVTVPLEAAEAGRPVILLYDGGRRTDGFVRVTADARHLSIHLAILC